MVSCTSLSRYPGEKARGRYPIIGSVCLKPDLTSAGNQSTVPRQSNCSMFLSFLPDKTLKCNKTQNTNQNMYLASISHFSRSLPLVRYSAASAEQFKTSHCITLQDFLYSEPFFRSNLNFFIANGIRGKFLWDNFWETQVEVRLCQKPGCREGVEQLRIRCSVSPLQWKH